jgi:hypothetical protein
MSGVPYKPNPDDPTIKAYLEREVKAGRLFGPFYSPEECLRDLNRAVEATTRKKRRRD